MKQGSVASRMTTQTQVEKTWVNLEHVKLALPSQVVYPVTWLPLKMPIGHWLKPCIYKACPMLKLQRECRSQKRHFVSEPRVASGISCGQRQSLQRPNMA
jgi:hypothetical protein